VNAPHATPGGDAEGDHPCALLRADADGMLVQVNSTLCRMVGRPAQDLLGQPIEILFTMAGRAMYQSYLLPLLRLHGQVEEFALALKAADGSARDVLIYATATGDGLRVALVPYRTRRAVDDELLRVRRAADQAPGMLFHFAVKSDGRAHFPYASEAVRTLYGCSPAMAGEDAAAVLDRLHADDRTQFTRSGPDGLRHFLVRLPQADGSQRWHEVHATARGELDGSCLWHGHVADVTQRRALEVEKASRHAAEQVRHAQTDFLGRISHELRTPLNAILGFSHLMVQDDEEPLSEAQRQQLQLIHTAGEQLLHLVNDVLDISRLQNGSFCIALAATDVRLTLDRCLALAGPQAARGGVCLQQTQGDRPLMVMADERRLEQVLGNLVGNAIKYNRAGGSVTVRAVACGTQACLEIEDTGLGMNDRQRMSLFQPFNRLGADAMGVPGTGLGLVITRQLVQQMGGALEVTSVAGQGSVFRVLLPLALPSGASSPEASRAAGGSEGGSSSEPAAFRTGRQDLAAAAAPRRWPA
jgi:signal transduction histidine kinase